jgi:8-oxo-dGTP pyrophosphatase MutT (NUDIX family)
MPSRFVAFHELPEDAPGMASLSYAVMIAHARDGVLLVHSRLRRVWELPGGALDPGETARQAAVRELLEESGCAARNTHWLGILEVDDGRALFGGCLRCDVDAVPEDFSNEETVSLGYWTRTGAPAPLGHADEALLRRFA